MINRRAALSAVLFWPFASRISKVSAAMMRAAGAALALEWSRRGHVTDWVVSNTELFLLGPPLTVHDVVTGRETRRATLRGSSTRPSRSRRMALTGTSLVVGCFDRGEGVVSCFEPQSLSLRWERRYQWPESRWSSDADFWIATDIEGAYVVMAGHTGDNVQRLNLKTGNTHWVRHVDAIVRASTPVLHDGQLLVRSIVDPFYPSGYGYYQAIEGTTGRIVWRLRLPDVAEPIEYAPLVTHGRAYVTTSVRGPKGTLYVIDVSDGRVIDQRAVENLRGPFAADGDVVFFGTKDAAAYNVATHQVVWQVRVKPQGTIGAPIGARGVFDRAARRLYLGEYQRDLYVLSADDGRIVDKIDLRGTYLDPEKTIFPGYGVLRMDLIGDQLFVGTPDGSLLVFRRLQFKGSER